MDQVSPREQPQPNETPDWSWPERSPAGTPSKTSSVGQQSPDDDPIQTGRALTLRTTVVALVSALMSLAAAFGLHVDTEVRDAIIAVATSAVALVIILRGRG